MENIQSSLLKLINKWKKVLLIILGSSILLSIIFSGSRFVRPLYKTSATLYPVNLLSYSEESPTEQMMQILLSNDLKRIVIDSLNLQSHYKINSNSRYAMEKTMQKFDSRVQIKRTQYESVVIDVFDRYPEFSHKLILSIIDTYNSLAQKLMKTRADEILIIKETLYFDKLAEVDSLKTLVDTLIQQAGLLEYNMLRESMRGAYPVLYGNGKKNGQDTTLSDFSFQIFYNQTLLENEIEALALVKTEYEKALSESKKELLYADIISEPIIPERKAYPIRWFIVLISVFSTMFIAVSVLIFLDRKLGK